jgi:hypothetical protein
MGFSLAFCSSLWDKRDRFQDAKELVWNQKRNSHTRWNQKGLETFRFTKFNQLDVRWMNDWMQIRVELCEFKFAWTSKLQHWTFVQTAVAWILNRLSTKKGYRRKVFIIMNWNRIFCSSSIINIFCFMFCFVDETHNLKLF